MKYFREEALRNIKPQYDENFGETCDWNNFLQSMFSFHCPMFDVSGLDEVTLSLLQNEYVCDEWSGWENTNKAFTMDNFPLSHLAVLPEGIVLTYHPYQIDCFVSGEYHVVIPMDKVTQCLKYRYNTYLNGLPQLKQFIK